MVFKLNFNNFFFFTCEKKTNAFKTPKHYSIIKKQKKTVHYFMSFLYNLLTQPILKLVETIDPALFFM